MNWQLEKLEQAFKSDGRQAPLMPWQILALFAEVQDNMKTIGTAAQKATENLEEQRLAAAPKEFVPMKVSAN